MIGLEATTEWTVDLWTPGPWKDTADYWTSLLKHADAS